MLDWISSPEAWIALLTLTILEIVLGIDNIVFVAILSDRVEQGSRSRARRVGLTIAITMRILLLFSIVWIMRLTDTLFTIVDHPVSGRDLILIAGGVFLLFKSPGRSTTSSKARTWQEKRTGITRRFCR